MLLGHYIIISIFLGRRPNVQDFNVSKQPWGGGGGGGGGVAAPPNAMVDPPLTTYV